MKKVLTFLLVFTLGFTLASCTNKEDVTNVQDAAQKLSLEVSDPMSVTSNIVLPTEGLHDSTITWESNNTAVIANDGTVTRPAVGSDDATVILTATLTVGKETYTKEFTFKVLAAVPSVAVTIAELESSAVAKGDVVEVTGVVVGIINTYGFQIYDGTGFSYAVQFAQPTVAIGDNVTVLGEKDIFNGGVQVAEIQSITTNSTGNAIPAFTSTTLSAIFAENWESTTWYNDMFNATAYVAVMGAYDNAYLTWFDATTLDLLQMEIYYKSGGQDRITEIKTFDGKLVDVDFILKDYYYGAYRVTVNTTGTVVENTSITDQDKANLAVAFNDLVFKGLGEEIVSDLDLPTSSDQIMDGDNGAALVWTSSNENVIATDGEVTLPSGNTETVTLTVTATVGTVTASKTYTVVVADKAALTVSTVTEALAMSDGTAAVVEGVVTGLRYGRPFIQDTDGTAMFVYSKLNVNVGDKVKLFGKIDTYSSNGNQMKQLTNAVVMEEVSTGNALVYNTTMTPAELAGDITANHATLFTMTLKWLSTDTANGYYFFEGYVDAADNTNNVRIKMDTDWFPELETYKDAITNEIQVSFLLYDVHYSEARIVPVAFPGLTEAQVLDIVKGMIDVAATDVTDDLDLITEIPMFDAVITWTSTNAAVAVDGTVTRPEAGAGNASGNVTASIVIGSAAAVVVDHAVTVLEGVAVPVSVAEAHAASNGTALYVEGVVTEFLPTGEFIIEDADGTAIIIGSYNTTLTWENLTVAIGDKVEVTGQKNEHYGFGIAYVTKVDIISSGNAITAPIVVTDMATFRSTPSEDMFGKRYTFTVQTGVDYVDKYNTYFYNDGNDDYRLSIVINNSYVGLAIDDNDILVFTAVLYGLNDSAEDVTNIDKIWRFAVVESEDITITKPSS